ncbi:MAG: acyl carrier protein [Gemmataceae bacterium]|nr:acyl carrier protein [Gemmataceae bacterium]MDW8264491.1 acyl carrier protein [Gemmataceae bacterium]
MERNALREALRKLVEEDRGEPVEQFDESLNLREQVGLDSVDVVSLVMAIQDRFGVVLTVADLEKVVTVADLLDVMQTKLAASQAA